jgi:glucarate dehydratase
MQLKDQLIGLDPFNLNPLRAIVQAIVAANKTTRVAGAELAPGYLATGSGPRMVS